MIFILKKNKRFIACIILFFVLIAVLWNASHFFPQSSQKYQYSILSSNQKGNEPANEAKSKQINLSNDALYSPYAILIQIENGEILFDKNSSAKIYPASMTKIMTALLAIEENSDLQEKVEVPKYIFTDLFTANASMAGFSPGEEVPFIDLLYGTMLPSGAEAAITLAIQTAESESKFIELMNQKAQLLGMEDTHFTNVHGLHDTDHYSTVNDIAILLQYALKNETFKEVFTSHQYSTSSSNAHPDGFTFYSTLFSKMNSCDFEDGQILGGKTGYTSEAGLCLASLAEKNDVEYILITAGAKGNHKTVQFNIKDAFQVYENCLYP